MGYKIGWDNPEKTVVLQQYVDPASKDDLYRLAKESANLLKSVSHTVHLIIDERNINMVLTMPDMNYLERLTPANQGFVILVETESKLKYKEVVQVIGKKVAPTAFSENKTFFSASIEEARLFLQEHCDVHYPANGAVSADG